MNSAFSRLSVLLIVLAFCVLGALSFWRLTEIPATWMDEGAIDQVAMNLAQKGIYGYQIAPGDFISAEFLTTGYPVVYPIALSFLLFGKSLFAARFIMVVFMFLLSISVYWYSTLLAPNRSSLRLFPIITLFLLISFAPLYGHGKNVLGEVPGLTFFVFSLVSLYIFEQKHRVEWLIFLSGILSGLSMATKPLYLILILPSSLCVFFLFRRKSFSLKEKGLFMLGMCIPLLWWIFAQSGDHSVLNTFFYGNPDQTSFISLITRNSARFFTEISPIYFLALLLCWWLGMLLKGGKDSKILTTEWFAFIFSFLNLISFLTTRGFYRYFFPSEVLALLFLPYALYSIMQFRLNPTRSLLGVVFVTTVLIGIQSYQLFFHSWVSDSQHSARATILSRELGVLEPERSVFFYNVPEAVLFLPHKNYYQYLRFADTVERGSDTLPLLERGRVDLVLVDGRFSTSTFPLNHYKEKSRFDKYTLYEKK